MDVENAAQGLSGAVARSFIQPPPVQVGPLGESLYSENTKFACMCIHA